MPWLALRIKPKGSAAGHNGMKSLISSLGTDEFVRVRLGIHPGHPIRDGADFVLAPFKRSQKKELEEFVDYAAGAVRLHNCRRRRKGHDEIQSSRPRLKHRGSMRIYEELFIVKPDAPEEEVDQFVEQLRTQLTGAGATVDKVDKWGKRRLAYRVEKYREGSYVLFQFTAGPEIVKELERRLRVSDIVLKFLTVRIDEKLKRLEKRKKVRDKRAARRAAAAPAAPAPGLAPAQPSLAQQMTEAGAAGYARPAEGGLIHGGIKRKTRQRRRSGPPAATRPSPRRRSNISGARKFAGSASRRSTTSTTRT